MPRSTRSPAPSRTAGPARGRAGGLLSSRDGANRLRRLAGNRAALGALDGPRLGGRSGPNEGRGGGLALLPPGGVPELQADRAAERALDHRPGKRGESSSVGASIPRLSAGHAGRGRAVSADLSRRISARSGGGRGIAQHVRRSIEPGFGVDFGRVRIHTDREAGRMVSALGAEAFTVGRDVYFAPGKYDPHTRSGRQRLAHELSHTVQQAGLVKGMHRKARPGLGTPTTTAIQGLISREAFERYVGKEDFSKLSAPDKAEERYRKILVSLDGYHTAREQDDGSKGARKTREGHLNKLRERCEKFIDKHGMSGHVGGGVWELRDEVNYEVGWQPWRSESITAFERKDFLEKAALSDKLRYGVRVYAWIANPLYAKFAKERSRLITKKKLNPFDHTESSELKDQAATTIIDTYRADLKDEERTKAIEALRTADCGHTWVGLERYTKDDGKLADETTYGFWPSEQVHPTQAVKGEVRHPDNAHRGDDNVREIFKEVGHDAFSKALNLAEQWRKSPPTYKMVERNCTTFGRDVARKAGVDFPDAYWTVPIVGGDIWNPNDLFDAMPDPKASVSGT